MALSESGAKNFLCEGLRCLIGNVKTPAPDHTAFEYRTTNFVSGDQCWMVNCPGICSALHKLELVSEPHRLAACESWSENLERHSNDAYLAVAILASVCQHQIGSVYHFRLAGVAQQLFKLSGWLAANQPGLGA